MLKLISLACLTTCSLMVLNCNNIKSEEIEPIQPIYFHGTAIGDNYQRVVNANVTIENRLGTKIASTTTNFNGSFGLEINQAPKSKVLVIKVSNGQIGEKKNTNDYFAIVGKDKLNTAIYITPLTTQAYWEAKNNNKTPAQAEEIIAATNKLNTSNYRFAEQGAFDSKILESLQLTNIEDRTDLPWSKFMDQEIISPEQNYIFATLLERAPQFAEIINTDKTSANTELQNLLAATQSLLNKLETEFALINNEIPSSSHAKFSQVAQKKCLNDMAAVIPHTIPIQNALNELEFIVTNKSTQAFKLNKMIDNFNTEVESANTKFSKFKLLLNDYSNATQHTFIKCQEFLFWKYFPILDATLNKNIMSVYNYFASYQLLAATLLSINQNIYASAQIFPQLKTNLLRQHNLIKQKIPTGIFIDVQQKMVWSPVLSKPQKTVDDFTKINLTSGEEVQIPIINNQTNLTGIKANNLNIPGAWQYYEVFSSYLGEYNLGTAFKKILTEDEKNLHIFGEFNLPYYDEWQKLICDWEASEQFPTVNDWLLAIAPSSWPSDYVNLKEVQGIKTETSPVKSFGLWLKKDKDSENDFAVLPSNYNSSQQPGTLKTVVQVAGYFYSFANLNDGSEYKYCYRNSNAKSETIIGGITYKTISCDDAQLQFEKYGVTPNSPNRGINMGFPLTVVATTSISDLSNFIVVPESEFPAVNKNCLELNP